ncbi:MAG: hypothetical protein ACT4ON_10225 [Bacteroidota bacterium]
MDLVLYAQKKANAEIVDFSLDTTIHYKLKYIGDSLNFQIEEYSEGKWKNIGESSESVALNLDKSKEHTTQNQFGPLQSGRKYRLKVTFPVLLISKELEYKK